MKLWIGIFFILILAFLTSKWKVRIPYLRKGPNARKVEFDVNVGLYVFGFVKIWGISCREDGVHFLFFVFPYNKLKIDKDSMKILKNTSGFEILKSLHLKLEKLNFDLKIGTEDVMLTVFLVFIVASFVSVLSAKNAKQINLKNYHYQIMPMYNKNMLSFLLSAQISMKMMDVIRIFKLMHGKRKQVPVSR